MGRPKSLTRERSRSFVLPSDPAIRYRVRGRPRLAAEPIPDRVELLTVPFAPAANRVFTPDELEARILAHMERVERECPPDQRGREAE